MYDDQKWWVIEYFMSNNLCFLDQRRSKKANDRLSDSILNECLTKDPFILRLLIVFICAMERANLSRKIYYRDMKI